MGYTADVRQFGIRETKPAFIRYGTRISQTLTDDIYVHTPYILRGAVPLSPFSSFVAVLLHDGTVVDQMEFTCTSSADISGWWFLASSIPLLILSGAVANVVTPLIASSTNIAFGGRLLVGTIL